MNTQRIPLIAGNWKLFKTIPEGMDWVNKMLPLLPLPHVCEVAFAPSYTALAVLNVHMGPKSAMSLIAQDVFYEDKGAFTGAVSASQLKDAGCRYALVGHSERRQYFGETIETTHQRIHACVRHGLTPVLCVGETLQEREQNLTFRVLEDQLLGAFKNLDASTLSQCVVAYEPVWAIGTGHVATPEQAQEAHAFIRGLLHTLAPQAAQQCRILYGGSVKPENASELLAKPDIDGALVGGASLDAASFISIVRACV
jgi:triosephosphate isomerase